MSDTLEKLRLKGQAEEDIYFAKRDRELIEALHRREPVRRPGIAETKARREAKAPQEGYSAVAVGDRRRPWGLVKFYRRLVKRVRNLVSR